ncbi:MAG: hypothetical protein ABWY93_22675 [Mycobacterium sp.]
MKGFEEPTLFHAERPAGDAAAQWPPLPGRPLWSRTTGSFGQYCRYCVMLAQSDPRGPLAADVRRPAWQRIDNLGAELLLCEWHATLFAEREPNK